MNQRDITRIAKALGAAHSLAFHAQTKSTAWAFCIDALAGAIADVQPGFDRAAFLAECRAEDRPAPHVATPATILRDAITWTDRCLDATPARPDWYVEAKQLLEGATP